MNKTLFLLSIFLLLSFFSPIEKAGAMPDSSFHINTTVPHYFNGVSSYESDETIIVLLHGSQLTSVEQLQKNLAEALHFSADFDGSLKALRQILFDRTKLNKKVDITFLEAVSLKQNIGAKYVQALLNLLNEAEAQNPDLVIVMYWN